MNLLDKAIKDGHLELSGSGSRERIKYKATGFSDRFDDPEELVRAEFYAELIYSYDYSPERIGVEVAVPDRVPSDRADLVVFRDDKRTKPFAVVECKARDVSDADFVQSIEQACGNGTWARFRADFVGVVAGLTRRFLDFTPNYGISEREANIIADLPRSYGKPGEFRFHKGSASHDIRRVDKGDMLVAFRKCHQTLWGGGKLSPPAAFSELCKIMFVKIADELEPRRSGEPYQFQIKTHEKSYRLAERIRALYAAARSRNPDVLSEDIKVDDSTIRTVVSHLEAINLSATDPDVKGLAFEQFMGGFFKGDSGQYFTPREVVKFIVSMYPPDHSDRVIDPACGSGGFLLASLEHMRDKATEYGAPGTIEHQRYWQEFASRNLYGIEINDEIARVAKMNMTLHGDGRTNLVCEDGLTGLERICRQTNNTGFAEGGFDLVLSNPPFGAQVSLGDRPYLGDYELGRTEDARGARRNRKSQKTEILFIERIYDLLIDEGRAAIILPDGVLTNASLQYVRDFILDRFRVEAVVSLPTLAFTHYGTTVKASVLFLRKRGSRDRPGDEEPIFMASPERIGYDSSGRPTDSQFDEILKQFRDFERDPRPFFV